MILKKIITCIIVTLFSWVTANTYAAIAKVNKYSDTTFVFKQDDPIAAMLDSLQYLKLWQTNATPTDISKLNIYNYKPDEVPVFEDLVYEARLAKLDAASPINLDYHASVRPYIDMYMSRRRQQVSKLLGLSKLYFPIFEETLDRYNLPLELKNLAVIESALNPTATSRVGATGLWQFMYGTGKMFNLNVTSYVDDRRDPYKATEAACKYFKFLYNMFGDWQLVLAAYNGGPGTVNKAIRRSGGKRTYWEIRPFLPVETQGYVPAFIAANYVMNYWAEHNVYPSVPGPEYFQVEALKTTQQVSFYQLAEGLNISVEELSYLNPAYKQRIIPFSENGSTLVLPVNKVAAFINNEQAIYAYKTPEEKRRELDASLAKSVDYKEVGKIHKVRRGETLKAIASKYGVSMAQLRKWNNIRSPKLKSGQRITVYVKVPVYYAAKKAAPETVPEIAQDSVNNAVSASVDSTFVKPEEDTSSNSANSAKLSKSAKIAAAKAEKEVTPAKEETAKPKIVYYKVNRGDTLWSIANRYPGITVKEIKEWNNIRSNSGLKAGSKIKVVINS